MQFVHVQKTKRQDNITYDKIKTVNKKQKKHC